MAAPAPPASAAQRRTEALIEELQDMALDPTLDQCCRRDLDDQIARERIRACLQAADRVDARTRAAAAAVVRDAGVVAAAAAAADAADADAAAAAAAAAAADGSAAQPREPGGGEGELAALRAARLAQLRAAAAAQAAGARAGLGSLNDVPEGKLLGLLAEPPGRGVLVAHLAVAGHEPCNALDETLAAAAARYRGTYFARVVVARGTPLVARLQLPGGVPALLVARDGALLGRAQLSQFGGHDIWEEEVLSYLRRFRALLGGEGEAGGARRPGGADDDAGASSGDESDGGGQGRGDWSAACEVCGRSYPHTHVRAIYATNERGSDESEGE
ncbi:hypothetical protein HT031_001080 [Scenedesmus sp. PABB004]|nr:hypothetical protein HT031_001080 [Scenedesmus sp. PABB004]